MVGYLLKKEVDIIRKVDLKMDEHQKYEVIKKLVDANGNKDRAAMTLGLSRRQVDRLIAAYKEKGKAAFVHGNRGRKPAITKPDDIRRAVVDLYRTKYYDATGAITGARFDSQETLKGYYGVYAARHI